MVQLYPGHDSLVRKDSHKMFYCVLPENIHTSPTEGIFSYDPPPLWKFYLTFIHFIINFLALQNPPPPGNSNPFCGGVWIFSGTAHSCPGVRPCVAVVSLNYVLSQLRSFRQRLVCRHLRSICQGPKSLCQRPTGQFANVSISSTNKKRAAY